MELFRASRFALLILALVQMSCTLRLSIEESLAPIGFNLDNTIIGGDNQGSFPISGTCQPGVTSFTIQSPPPEQVVSCVDGKWSAVVDFGSDPEGPVNVVTDLKDNKTGDLITYPLVKDITPPTVSNFTIKAGALRTKDLQNPFSFVNAESDVADVYLTEIAACAGGGVWTPFSITRNVLLSGGDSVKNVYLKARDKAGNESVCLQTQIELDQTAPIISGLQEDNVVKGSKSWAWSCNETCQYRFVVSADPMLEPTGLFSSVANAEQLSGDGRFYIAVQAQDDVGNISNVVRVSAKLSTTLPGFTINAGAVATNDRNVNLNLVNMASYEFIDVSNQANCASATEIAVSSSIPWVIDTGDGTKTVYLRLRNTAGESTECISSSIVLDTVVPVVTGLADNLTPANSGNWTWSCSDANPCLYRYVIDQVAATNPTGSYDGQTSAGQSGGDGIYYIHVQARDTAGLESPVVHAKIILDNTSPVVTGLADDSTPRNTKNWTWSCLDASSCEYIFLVDTSPSSVPTGVFSSTTVASATGSGDFYVHVQAKDQAGNLSAVVHARANLDDTPPVLTRLASDPTPALGKTWSWNCTDVNLCQYRYLVDQNPTATLSGAFDSTITATPILPSGTYYLHVQAQDAAGNLSSVGDYSFIIDVDGPTLLLSSTTTTSTSLNPILVTATFNESAVGFSASDISVTNGTVTNFSGSGTTYTFDIVPTAQGTVLVSVPAGVVTDGLGNLSSVAATLTRVYDSVAPTVTLSSAAAAFTNVSPIVFTATFNETVMGFTAAGLAVVNGTASISGSGNTYTISVTPSVAGNVSVTVNANAAQDAAANKSTASAQVTKYYDVTVPTPPSVTNIAYTTSGAQTPVVSWSGAADAQSGIARYDVAVGTAIGSADVKTWTSVGTVTSTTVTGLALSAGGLYYVSVRVVDNAGNISSIATGPVFRYLATPTISSVSPNSGALGGGTPITISGSQFYAPMTVTVGGVSCGSINVASTVSITCTTPAGSAGAQNVVVANQAGLSATLAGGFTYLAGDGAVAGGTYHTCGVSSSGAAKCWGYNNYGQLGNGTTANSLVPVVVSGLSSGVRAVSTGGYFSCALMNSGVVYCWGDNTYGQLGDGTTVQKTTPVAVSGLSGVVSLTSGGAHSCALLNTGGVVCWGYNTDGAIGDGSTTNRTTPVAVSGMSSGVKMISAAGTSGHTCALLNSGPLYCWGSNLNGEVGDGSTTSRTTPVAVSGLSSGVASVTTGYTNTCVAMTDGTGRCWGDNYNGQLGDNTKTDRLVPTVVVGLSGAKSFALMFSSSCALLTSGTVTCWGLNTGGQLGDGTTTQRLAPATTVSGLTGAQSIGAGLNQACAINSAGNPLCWGANSDIMSNPVGQVGSGGSAAYYATPQAVANFP